MVPTPTKQKKNANLVPASPSVPRGNPNVFLPIRCFKINKLVSITYDLGTFQTVVLLWVLGKYVCVEALQEKIFYSL